MAADTPPVASDLAITPGSPGTGDDLAASYTYYDEEQHTESDLTQIRWYKNDSLQTAYNDASAVLSSSTAKGQDWYFTVKPHDGFEFGELQTSASVTIGNTPPTASDLSVSPSAPVTGDDLLADYSYDDADGDPESGSTIRWHKNDVLQSAYNDSTAVPSSATWKDQQWYFTVRPKDGTDPGDLQQSPVFTIGNTRPVASDPAISPESPVTEDDLAANYDYSDADDDPESGSTVRWYKNDSLQSAYNDQEIVSSSSTARGQRWRFTVRPGDGTELGTYQTSPTVTIGNTLPEANSLSISPSSPLTGDDLLATYDYNDADGDTETGTEVKWYKNGDLQAAYNIL